MNPAKFFALSPQQIKHLHVRGEVATALFVDVPWREITAWPLLVFIRVRNPYVFER